MTEAPPEEASLHAAALTYLARYAATEASLRRVLLRRIDRWAKAQPDAEAAAVAVTAARQAVGAVVTRLVAAGVLDDAAFAASRGLGLQRSGVSRRGIAARLAAKGIDPVRSAQALPEDDDAELAAALVLTRKRRIGPFRATTRDDPAARRREFGILARAGFPAGIARAALDMAAEEAEARILALRR
jgi:regulatory protein